MTIFWEFWLNSDVWVDVKRRMWVHQVSNLRKKNWDIRYCRYVWHLNILVWNGKFTISESFKDLPHNGGWVWRKFEIFNYLGYGWWPKFSQEQELTMIFLWKVELGSKDGEKQYMSFPLTTPPFSHWVQISNFSNLSNIHHFLWTSVKNGSISNILWKINSPSNFDWWTYVESRSLLTFFRSKKSFQVQKTYSSRDLDWLLKCASDCNALHILSQNPIFAQTMKFHMR